MKQPLIFSKKLVSLTEAQIKKGAQGIIAGCTEILLVLRNGDTKISVIDPTLVLAQRAVEEAWQNITSL